jgi:hypothetical protein
LLALEDWKRHDELAFVDHHFSDSSEANAVRWSDYPGYQPKQQALHFAAISHQLAVFPFPWAAGHAHEAEHPCAAP